MHRVLLIFTAAGLVYGQSSPTIANVTNGALPSLDSPPSSIALAPRTIATIYGTGLASTTAFASLPWPSSLARIEVHLADDNCFNLSCDLTATLIYVSPTQINFVVPGGEPQFVHAYRIVFVQNGQRIDNRS
jgi:uncharacterized protein (TIGR03437 family)